MPSLFRKLAILLSNAAVLAGCTVGPNYGGAPQVAPLSTARAAFQRAGDVPTNAADPVARWWTALGDPLLDRLIDEARATSPSLAIAEARLRQSRATLRQRERDTAPNANASAVYAHAELPEGIAESSGSSAIDFYNLGFDASWEIDLFGGRRRGVEAARANAGAVEARLADAQVSLAAELAQDYVRLRDQQARLRLAQEASTLQGRMVSLTRQRFAGGTASALDVERLRAQLETTQAGLVPLQTQVRTSYDQIAVLTGREPGTLDAVLAPVGMVPLPPAQVAVGDPAAMLRRRPDVRAAERALAASSAQIGVNVARMFPTVSLLGLIGFGGADPGDIVDPSALTVLAAPMLRWNFLNFGRVRAQVRGAEAARDEAVAQYRQTVLAALQDAESALTRFGGLRNNVAALQRAEASATRTAALARTRYAGGTATLTESLDAERQRLSSSQSRIQAQAEMTNAFIALQKSLGLGWTDGWVAPEGAAVAKTAD
ncbi:MAG TPA: efflux transporter outer membrane subunit [Sphingomonas sp.]|jgi:NodT family efflux transporter outer membrane factor (OMF) lipoprotein|uniref:efflux transporter outer membrane subunit n=1 Tax=Sphingomonas sp. TaxID=28214 RepID=UPI002ED83B13